MKRVLTVVIEFDQDSRPSWIWESIKDRKIIKGVLVNGIEEGNLMARVDAIETKLIDLEDMLPCTLEEILDPDPADEPTSETTKE